MRIWEGCELICTAGGMGMCYCSVLISKEQSDLSLMGETADCQSLQSKVVAHRLLLEKFPSNAQVGRKYQVALPGKALPLHARDTLKFDELMWESFEKRHQPKQAKMKMKQISNSNNCRPSFHRTVSFFAGPVGHPVSPPFLPRFSEASPSPLAAVHPGKSQGLVKG